jgi:DNA helicase-2/ATP-dependent DNA helicase PcrA
MMSLSNYLPIKIFIKRSGAMSMSKQEWREEQERVEWVIGEIEKQVAVLQQNVSETKIDIVDIRKNFWDDVTVYFDDPTEAAETYASIKQQAEVLSERERSHRHAQNQLMTLKRLKQSPYFGRIDFIEDGEKEAERIYLGIASLLDETDENFLVYDWRAPVSSLYYDYLPGPVQYETPGGTVTGTMELKRQYVIRDGHIRSMFDTGLTIGDELLQEVLGKQADSHMKSIVSTIQKEQNRIIRNERSRLLIVQGAAGSGKTSAALQRVAYLLYRYRETLRAENIVLFSPNPMFNSYVSTVLPELGEENMQQTTFQEYLERRLSKTFRLEDPFTQMEYTLTAMDEPGYTARIEGIQYKATTDFMKLIERYVAFLGREGMIFKDVKFRGEIVVSAERIKEQFYALDPSLSIPNRMKLLTDWLLKKLKEQAHQEQTKPWVEDEIELLDKEAYLRAYQKLLRKRQYTEDTFDDFDRERELLASMVVQERFKLLRARVKRLRFVDMPAIYRQLFAEPQYISRFTFDSLPKHWEEICAQTLERLNRIELAYEDAAPYLYVKEQIEGFQTNTSVRHVFIDEAQDYSPFQFAFIKRLFPRSKMTVLGDLNQAIYAHTATSVGFAALSSLYENEQTETFVLRRSYRSTLQIAEFTRGLINGGEIEPFNREGSKPTVTQAADERDLAVKVAERVRLLQAAGHRTIAVICKTAQESQEAYEMLQDYLSLCLIGKETASFESGTLVIPSYLAKGVEFDAVIVYNGSRARYGRESERKLFYTTCTRAMHELHIYFIGEMSPFISAVSPDTYVSVN